MLLTAFWDVASQTKYIENSEKMKRQTTNQPNKQKLKNELKPEKTQTQQLKDITMILNISRLYRWKKLLIPQEN